MDNTRPLRREEYEEPACLLNMNAEAPRVHPIDLMRVMARLDEYLSHDDYAAAERHLAYWLDEALRGQDKRSAYTLYNEQMGLLRKTNQREPAFAAMENALALADELGFAESITGGTGFLNAATVCTAFGESERALPLFRRAQAVYERELDASDGRLGGLYNNMALCCAAMDNYDDAFAFYARALEVMAQTEHGEGEQAITCLNMANAVEDSIGMEDGIERIEAYVEQAMTLLDTPDLPQDGNHAFICEKCAPTLDYYGQFIYAAALRQRAKEIYERT